MLSSAIVASGTGAVLVIVRSDPTLVGVPTTQGRGNRQVPGQRRVSRLTVDQAHSPLTLHDGKDMAGGLPFPT